MLTELLPGIRDLRTPFASGVLWIVCGWLLLSSQITRAKHPELFEAIDSLGSALRPIGIGVSITLAAYLVGVAFEFIWGPIFRAIPALSARGQRSIYRLVSERLGRLSDEEIEILARCRSFSFRHDPNGGRHGTSYRPFRSSPRDDITADLLAAVHEELDLSATRLLTGGKATSEEGIRGSKGLFDVYDRLHAEAEFRVAITLPVCGLLTMLLLDVTTPWVAVPIGMLALLVFGIQGAAKKTAAGDRIVDAMLIDVVEAPALADVRPGVYTRQALDEQRIRFPDPSAPPELAVYSYLGVPWTRRLLYLVLAPAQAVGRGIAVSAGAFARAVGWCLRTAWLGPRTIGRAIKRAAQLLRFGTLDLARNRGAVMRELRLLHGLRLGEEEQAIKRGDLYRDYGFYGEATRAYPETTQGELRRSEAALEAFQVRASRKDARLLAELMDEMIAEDRSLVAERICREALRAGSKHAHILLGDLLQIRGDIEAAERAYRKAAALGLANGLTRIGDLRLRSGERAEARRFYVEASSRGAAAARTKLNELDSLEGAKQPS